MFDDRSACQRKKLKKFEYDNKNVDSIDYKSCEGLFENDDDDFFEMFLDFQKMKIVKKNSFFFLIAKESFFENAEDDEKKNCFFFLYFFEAVN